MIRSSVLIFTIVVHAVCFAGGEIVEQSGTCVVSSEPATITRVYEKVKSFETVKYWRRSWLSYTECEYDYLIGCLEKKFETQPRTEEELRSLRHFCETKPEHIRPDQVKSCCVILRELMKEFKKECAMNAHYRNTGYYFSGQGFVF